MKETISFITMCACKQFEKGMYFFMKELKKIILLLGIMILGLTGCSKQELTMESKIEAEIDFCENESLNFLRKVENDEYIKDDILQWNDISNDNNTFTNSIPVIEADLASVNLENNKIEDIKSSIQNIKQYSESKDIEKLTLEYAIFYNKITSVKLTDNRELKILAMNGYINALNSNDTELMHIITEIENKYKNLKSNEEFTKINGLSLKKISENIKDLKTCLSEKDYKMLRAHCLKIIEIM